jgi:DNA repair exonuclease SbcCD ATPase subunit
MKQVNFKRVAIQHFLSVGEEPVEVKFDKGLHVITGENKDKPDRRNAIGKSTVADSIYFAIFGDTLRELKKDLIPNNITGGKTHVELDFEVVTPSNTRNFKIVRHLNPSKVFLYEDGVDKTRDSIGNTNKYICDMTSATPSIFQNCVIMTVNNAVPFMAKNKIEKRKFIEDIFGLEVFSKMLSQIRAEYNDIKRESDIEVTKMQEVKTTLGSYNNQRDSVINRRQEKKKLYLERRDNNTRDKKALQEDLATFVEGDTDAIKAKIDDLYIKRDTCEDKISEYVGDIGEKKAEVTHTKSTYSKIGTDEAECPVCLRPMADHDVEHMESEKETLRVRMQSMVGDIKVVNAALTNAKEIKTKVQAAINGQTNKLSEVKLANQKRVNINQQIAQINEWEKELDIDLAAVEKGTTDFDDLISETGTRLKDIEKKVSKFKKELAKLDIVKYVVSEEGVKSVIVNKLLELLNSKLLHYLKKLDSNSICIFNEYFEEEIINEKNKICSYFNFSGAERKAMDLACLFTFSDLRRMQGGVKYNLAIYDELFDSSFDDKGLELVTQILQERTEELNECSIVISHRKESIKAATGDVIFLTKENGITKRVAFEER